MERLHRPITKSRDNSRWCLILSIARSKTGRLLEVMFRGTKPAGEQIKDKNQHSCNFNNRELGWIYYTTDETLDTLRLVCIISKQSQLLWSFLLWFCIVLHVYKPARPLIPASCLSLYKYELPIFCSRLVYSLAPENTYSVLRMLILVSCSQIGLIYPSETRCFTIIVFR